MIILNNLLILQPFRLKKGYKNLSNEVYAKNLMVYLKRISSCVEVDMSDFKEALKMLEK